MVASNASRPHDELDLRPSHAVSLALGSAQNKAWARITDQIKNDVPCRATRSSRRRFPIRRMPWLCPSLILTRCHAGTAHTLEWLKSNVSSSPCQQWSSSAMARGSPHRSHARTRSVETDIASCVSQSQWQRIRAMQSGGLCPSECSKYRHLDSGPPSIPGRVAAHESSRVTS